MKFCIEAAVSAAQGGTAVRPPPPKVGNWTGFMQRNIFIFFTQKNQLKIKLATYD